MAPQHSADGVEREVFTTVEVARAAGVPVAVVENLIRTGRLRVVPGTRFIAGTEAVALAPEIRAAAAAEVPRRGERLPLGDTAASSAGGPGGSRWPAAAGAHALMLAAALWMAGLRSEPALSPAPDTPRLVFLVMPGPGGGGGGGGARASVPPSRAERSGTDRAALSVPPARADAVRAAASATEPPRVARTSLTPIEPPPPAPLPSARLIAPIAGTSPAARDREGTIDAPAEAAASQGAGTGGGAGTGAGTGSGSGTGAGLGPGEGGGTGGGVYRPGSGIEPPRLLREVKAIYTEDARRRGITGEVLLEVVVTREGGVGDVRVLRGLDKGLDARAIDAVREWRFAPARRLGEPVDVLVEVAVEFSLR